MKAAQAGLLLAAAVVMGVLTIPPLLESRKVNAAVSRLELLSDAAGRYARQTGTVCADPNHLLKNPGAEGWRGPYLDSPNVLQTPWGGRFVFDAERGLVGIAADHPSAPKRYRLGAEAELSAPIRDDPDWWPSDERSDALSEKMSDAPAAP